MNYFFIDVNGGWTEWGKCNQYCGGGTQMRTCSNPPRSGSGDDCKGDAIQPCGEDA